jgi:tRNA-Thr(GGU) m(6)t(6)A37 methyltransferase TsaA
MSTEYTMHPIGWVRRQADQQLVEVEAAYLPALLGVEQYSHLWILYWFSENDNPQDRRILQVHPCRQPANPLTGVFGTRAPVRPNLIGLCAVRLVGREGGRLVVQGLDARDGTPVVDIKPYLPDTDAIPQARAPKFVPGPPRDGSRREGQPA